MEICELQDNETDKVGVFPLFAQMFCPPVALVNFAQFL
jgi:hypothetical protein